MAKIYRCPSCKKEIDTKNTCVAMWCNPCQTDMVPTNEKNKSRTYD